MDPHEVARESAAALSTSVLHTQQLGRVVKELEGQLRDRAREMASMKERCDHAAVLASFVREDCEILRDKLTVAEAEVKRLTAIITPPTSN
jgi:hypothetical protein